jgi:hypothetical protein
VCYILYTTCKNRTVCHLIFGHNKHKQ